MTTTRRDFIKRAAALAGGLGAVGGVWPESIRRAMAIEPGAGTTFLDAEHVVILMQENRSFDHTFGSLRGVRGFSDPRAIRLPDGCPVWAQADAKGRRFLPFRMDIKATKATWMGSLPHSWTDQVDARNGGRYDQWLKVKASGEESYGEMPLAMGYYAREDIPFYYALADAFTVCDQNFCSTLTGTTPNRLHLWTGTIREKQSRDSFAHVLNSDVDYWKWAEWATLPERLEDLGVSWKVYQNEISLRTGLEGEHNAWLSSFEDNPLEWFTQYRVLFAAKRREFVQRRLRELTGEIAETAAQLASAGDEASEKLRKRSAELMRDLAARQAEAAEYTSEGFHALTERTKRLHERAFTNNSGDPDYRELELLSYRDGATDRTMVVPKGDPLHRFRKDVAEGTLPTVSWLVPSERFSDHPCSAWFGAWYLSEAMDILTKNPDVWRKTVFILTYDENDGYFDHVPPFVAPNPDRPETGKVSDGIDAGLEFVTLEQDTKWHPRDARESPLGLGYRVPMVIASPWSRGGAVCSQVFDHTSIVQFLERVVSHKTGKPLREPNINSWRRAVCGDLTSAFTAANSGPVALTPLNSPEFLAQIYRAQFADVPRGYRELDKADVEALRHGATGLMPKQEPGSRPSCPLPYELFVTASLNKAKDELVVRLEARNELFKERASGAPFTAYAFTSTGEFACRNYAVEPGKAVEDSWKLSEFAGGMYDLRVYAPNGTYWEMRGDAHDPEVSVWLASAKADAQTPDVEIRVDASASQVGVRATARDLSYGHAEQSANVGAGDTGSVFAPTVRSARWYDLGVGIDGSPAFARRFAGRLETGRWGVSDPLIGA